jgi:hypothetical protein
VELALFLLVLLLVGAWISAPLRRPPTPPAAPDPGVREEAEARLVAVRDAELDAATGKLTAAEHRALDAQLRAEAIDALRRAEHGG